MTGPDLTAAFLLGLLGTGHCVGMCGPLVFAFPGQTGRVRAHLYYHAGRILTYAAVGALMGAIGSGLVRAAGAAGGDGMVLVATVQVGLSAVAAVGMILFGVIRLGLIPEPDWMAAASPDRLPGFRRTLRSATDGGAAAMFPLGLMMGLLPCGLSFAAFAMALPVGGPAAGGLMLLTFGLGTLPGLMLVGVGLAGPVRRYRAASEILSGMLMVGMGASWGIAAVMAILG